MKFTLFFLVSCFLFNPAVAENPFSANDLSILFPMTDATKMKHAVTLNTKEWPVVSSEILKQVLAGAEEQGVFLNSKLRDGTNWTLVALRYTPCNNLAGVNLNCIEQIRFVYQPLNALESLPGINDYAMHVIYEYGSASKAEVSPRTESFRKIKNRFSSSLDKPLQVHPILNSEEGAVYLNAIKSEVIDNHIKNRNPSKITFMGLHTFKTDDGIVTEDPDKWVFFSGDIDAKGVWELTLLPTSAKHKSQILTADIDTGDILSSIKIPKADFSLFGKNDTTTNAIAILDIKKPMTIMLIAPVAI